MKIILCILGLLWIWIIYEFWSAPLMQENEDGSWTTIRPSKKIKDLWKK